MEADLKLETHFGLSKARSMLSALVDRVLSGNVAVIERRRESVVVVDARQLEQILAQAFPFAPEVYLDGESGVAIWLPELEIGAEGDDLEDAKSALIGAVVRYVEAWQEDLRRAPNHEARFGWVHRVQLASSSPKISAALFGEDGETAYLRPTSAVLRS